MRPIRLDSPRASASVLPKSSSARCAAEVAHLRGHRPLAGFAPRRTVGALSMVALAALMAVLAAPCVASDEGAKMKSASNQADSIQRKKDILASAAKALEGGIVGHERLAERAHEVVLEAEAALDATQRAEEEAKAEAVEYEREAKHEAGSKDMVVVEGAESEHTNEEKEGRTTGRREDEEEGILAAGEEEFTKTDLAIAIMLLGFITFIMFLFVIVNHHDSDMQFYAWSVINETVSIFVAVLFFSSLNTWLHVFINDHIGTSRYVHAAGDFAQVAAYFSAMQMSVYIASGAREEKPFARGRKRRHGWEKVEMSIIEQKERKERKSKCWAMLLSHTTGFATTNFGAAMQHGDFFRHNPPATFLVVPMMYAFHLVVGGVCEKWRLDYIKEHDPEDSFGLVYQGSLKSDAWLEEDLQRRGRLYALQIWNEMVVDAMTDVASLSISFLTVQACRFNISGVLPDNLGIEHHHYLHSYMCSVKLFSVGVLFASLTVVFVVLSDEQRMYRLIKDEHRRSMVQRSMIVGRNSMGTAFSWCLLYTCKWEIARIAPQINGITPELANPNSIGATVLLALTISLLAFVLIRICDVLADASFTDEQADEAIYTIIQSLAILVGFSWEQSFDEGVEVIASLTPMPITTALIIASFVSWVVIAPWRKFILHKVLKMEKERARHVKLSSILG